MNWYVFSVIFQNWTSTWVSKNHDNIADVVVCRACNVQPFNSNCKILAKKIHVTLTLMPQYQFYSSSFLLFSMIWLCDITYKIKYDKCFLYYVSIRYAHWHLLNIHLTSIIRWKCKISWDSVVLCALHQYRIGFYYPTQKHLFIFIFHFNFTFVFVNCSHWLFDAMKIEIGKHTHTLAFNIIVLISFIFWIGFASLWHVNSNFLQFTR